MNSEEMKTGSEKFRIYETLFSSPGMGEKCKIILQMTRQNILMLSRIIEMGLEKDQKVGNPDFLSLISKESAGELKILLTDILEKAGLSEFYKKLKSL